MLKIMGQTRPKIIKNWFFNEKMHRIRKSSQNRFAAFSQDTYDAKEVIHNRIFVKSRKYLNIWAQTWAKNL